MPRLQDFTGLWRLERQVTDALGPDARFAGTADFTPDKSGLLMCESGVLELEGQGSFQAERRYLWQDQGAWIAVLFSDGRAFHSFDPQLDSPEADHWCDPDTYKVRYDFTCWPVWQVEWHVTGPRKDYVMRSVFRR